MLDRKVRDDVFLSPPSRRISADAVIIVTQYAARVEGDRVVGAIAPPVERVRSECRVSPEWIREFRERSSLSISTRDRDQRRSSTSERAPPRIALDRRHPARDTRAGTQACRRCFAWCRSPKTYGRSGGFTITISHTSAITAGSRWNAARRRREVAASDRSAAAFASRCYPPRKYRVRRANRRVDRCVTLTLRWSE